MSRIFDPSSLASKWLPKAAFITASLKLSKTAINQVLSCPFVNMKEALLSVRNVLDQYKKKQKELIKEEDLSKAKAIKEAYNKGKLVEMRMENLITHNAAQEFVDENKGQRFVWLPSSAQNPRHEHIGYYGKVFTVGDIDDFPGLQYGCKCAARMLDDEIDSKFE